MTLTLRPQASSLSRLSQLHALSLDFARITTRGIHTLTLVLNTHGALALTLTLYASLTPAYTLNTEFSF